MELCSVLLRAWAKAFRSALRAKAALSPSVMDVVSRLSCMRICMRQTRCCMPLGLHLAACDKLGTALRSPSDIGHDHSPGRPTPSCRTESRSTSDKVRGLETNWIALPLRYLLRNLEKARLFAIVWSYEQARRPLSVKRP